MQEFEKDLREISRYRLSSIADIYLQTEEKKAHFIHTKN